MAEKDKVFYWIKLKKEFMDGEAIDFMMSQKNGANYVVLYQMLIMKTINTNGKLCNEIGEMIIPYDVEKIQRDCKWFDIDTVRVALELYCKLGLIYKNQDNIFQITNFEEVVGSETYWAKQKRISREKENEIGQCPTNVQKPLISNIYISNNNNSNNKEVKHKYGEYKHILLTDSEMNKLKEEHSQEQIDKAIKKVDEYIEISGKKYKSHYLVIRKWGFENKEVKEKKIKQNFQQREYDKKELSNLYDDINDIDI